MARLKYQLLHYLGYERQLHLNGMLCLLISLLHPLEVASRIQFIRYCNVSIIEVAVASLKQVVTVQLSN